MKYLLLYPNKTLAITDEITFKMMRDVADGHLLVVKRAVGYEGYKQLKLPTDWSTGDIEWEEIK